jgi:alpha-L-fucosidase
MSRFFLQDSPIDKKIIIVLGCVTVLNASATPGQSLEYPHETHAPSIPAIADLPPCHGPFDSSVESLKKYKCPEWFRDAKFGIWAHWGPQAVPKDGDWYARRLYSEGRLFYRDHLAEYGHPSKSGYKDIIPLWKAEKWDPDELMALYKAAGAHYFMAQAVHHDNFDNWDSKYHKWNSVAMGPKKDIVALWQAAARKEGLRFGVSEHLGHAYTFLLTAHAADKNGPLAGVPYDGNDPAFSDLYGMPAKPGDDKWYSTDPRWQQEWYARIHDLISRYQPDLLYSDGGVPFGETGRKIMAHLYNTDIQRDGGSLNAVYFSKKNYPFAGSGEYFDGTCVMDRERGGSDDISPDPWQCDTSTGDWYFNRRDEKYHRYKSSSRIIQMLADTVSKNGNLLLNVTLDPDGSLPPEMRTLLDELTDWMKVNGEAIFSTRPWVIYGEGISSTSGGSFNENTPYSPYDIRFTKKDGDLYAITLGVPTGKVVIHALAKNSPLVETGPTDISLLGYQGKLHWMRSDEGLVIDLPTDLKAKSALCFKISGLGPPPTIDPKILGDFKRSLNEEYRY